MVQSLCNNYLIITGCIALSPCFNYSNKLANIQDILPTVSKNMTTNWKIMVVKSKNIYSYKAMPRPNQSLINHKRQNKRVASEID